MKKLLVLSLVLAVAGLANAGLDLSEITGLSYEVVDNAVIISSENGVTGFAFSLMTDNGSDMSGAVVAPGFVGINNPGVSYAGNWDGVGASVGTAALVTGEIFRINFAEGVQKIYFVASDNEFFDASTIQIGAVVTYLSNPDLTSGVAGSMYEMTVPEPMTMVLLALGGLFIRRK